MCIYDGGKGGVKSLVFIIFRKTAVTLKMAKSKPHDAEYCLERFT